MTFVCAARYGDMQCPSDQPGDTSYMGFIQLCADHQDLFEMAATTTYLRDEVQTATVKRGPLGFLMDPDKWGAAPDIAPKVRPESTVYYMRNNGYCKIGHSINPERRLMCIRGNDGTLYPDDVSLPFTSIVAIESGGYSREQELHRQFAHLRHTGEWFTETPELTAHIERLTA